MVRRMGLGHLVPAECILTQTTLGHWEHLRHQELRWKDMHAFDMFENVQLAEWRPSSRSRRQSMTIDSEVH